MPETCLMDVWAKVEPEVCKANAKGWIFKIKDYMPVLVAEETATGYMATLGAVLYLTHMRGMHEQLARFASDKGEGDLLELALRRYLFELTGVWHGRLSVTEEGS